MNAAYLVDNVALLSLHEKQDGVEFHCFDMDGREAHLIIRRKAVLIQAWKSAT